MPDAAHLYACDQKWWRVHIEQVKAGFRGKRYTQWRDPSEKAYAEEHGIIPLQGASNAGLGRDKLHYGQNSGYQAINLAYLLGATRIILLGYDMQKTGGKDHWFGSHPQGLINGNYSDFVHNFTQLAEDLRAEGVEVINCSRETALTQFKRADLCAALS